MSNSFFFIESKFLFCLFFGKSTFDGTLLFPTRISLDTPLGTQYRFPLAQITSRFVSLKKTVTWIVFPSRSTTPYTSRLNIFISQPFLRQRVLLTSPRNECTVYQYKVGIAWTIVKQPFSGNGLVSITNTRSADTNDPGKQKQTIHFEWIPIDRV